MTWKTKQNWVIKKMRKFKESSRHVLPRAFFSQHKDSNLSFKSAWSAFGWRCRSVVVCTTTVLTYDIVSRILNRCMHRAHTHVHTTPRHTNGMLVALSNLRRTLKDSHFSKVLFHFRLAICVFTRLTKILFRRKLHKVFLMKLSLNSIFGE